jgi:hypothetical protein
MKIKMTAAIIGFLLLVLASADSVYASITSPDMVESRMELLLLGITSCGAIMIGDWVITKISGKKSGDG